MITQRGWKLINAQSGDRKILYLELFAPPAPNPEQITYSSIDVFDKIEYYVIDMQTVFNCYTLLFGNF